MSAVEEYRKLVASPYVLTNLFREREMARLAITELEAENERLWSVIGSVSVHDRVFAAHLAAAMKKYDAERGTP